MLICQLYSIRFNTFNFISLCSWQDLFTLLFKQEIKLVSVPNKAIVHTCKTIVNREGKLNKMCLFKKIAHLDVAEIHVSQIQIVCQYQEKYVWIIFFAAALIHGCQPVSV